MSIRTVQKGGLAGLMMLTSGVASADLAALATAAQSVCAKAKQCVTQQLATTENIPPGMEAMIDAAVVQMCSQFKKFNDMPENHEMIEPATACLISIADSPCDELMSGDGQTEACKTAEALAQKYQH